MIAIAFMALLLVNGILLMRLRGLQGQNTSTLVRLRGMETERETLTTIIRELRYKVDRQEQARRYLIPTPSRRDPEGGSGYSPTRPATLTCSSMN